MTHLSSDVDLSKNNPRIRVMMLGPGKGVSGGIAALVEMFLPDLSRQVDLLYVPTVEHRSLRESGKISIKNFWRSISQYFRFLAACYRFRPQIVHLHTSQGIAWLKDTFFILVSKIFHCRFVLHMHGGNFTHLYHQYHPLLQKYTRWVLGLADVVITVYDGMKNWLKNVVTDERLFTLRNCIAVYQFELQAAARSTPDVRIFFLGTVGESKGLYDLLQAVEYLITNQIPIRVWIAGYEEKKGDLQRLQAYLTEHHLENRCELEGFVEAPRKMELFREANLFVLPSYHECLPMSILEAMSAGLPIIATPVGGIPEVVQDGWNGFLVSPGDVKTLAEKIVLLSRDSQLRERMGRQSRALAEKEFNAGLYVDRLVALYKAVMAGKGANG